MAKVFKNGKWEESAEPYVPVKPAPAKPVFKDGKWTGGAETKTETKAEPFVDPRDVEPIAPKPAVNDADRPRWVSENVRYLEAVSNFRARQQFKIEHPELKGISWHVATK